MRCTLLGCGLIKDPERELLCVQYQFCNIKTDSFENLTYWTYYLSIIIHEISIRFSCSLKKTLKRWIGCCFFEISTIKNYFLTSQTWREDNIIPPDLTSLSFIYRLSPKFLSRLGFEYFYHTSESWCESPWFLNILFVAFIV